MTIAGRIRTAAGLHDTLFVALVAVLSVGLYVRGLGFYSDDWAFLGWLHNLDESVVGLARAQLEAPNIESRPTQAAYQAILYSLFGLEPLGYHLVNAGVLVLAAIVLHWVLRELGLPRVVTLAVPLVYVVMPNYSTDRFWFAAFGYALSMCLLFVSLFADLRAVRNRSRWLPWKALALAALAVSSLGYEVVIPLFVLGGFIVVLHARRLAGGGVHQALGGRAAAAGVVANLLVLALVLAYKAETAVGAGIYGGHLRHAGKVLFGSTVVNFGTYGVGLPAAAWWGVVNSSWPALAVGAGLALLVFVYLARVLRAEPSEVSRAAWLKLGGAGIVVFALGYAVFLTTHRITFTSTGTGNRTAIAGALGVAICMVAALGLLGSVRRLPVLPALLAAVCTSMFVITSSLSSYWTESWVRQEAVLADVRTSLPRLQPGTSLILHGVCPYTGPAIVFESNWDLAGTLQAAYREPSLRADVTSNRLTVHPDGLSTVIYNSIKAFYPFGDRLLLFDRTRMAVEPVTGPGAYRDYFRRFRSPHERACPRGSPGVGVQIFSFDDLARHARM